MTDALVLVRDEASRRVREEQADQRRTMREDQSAISAGAAASAPTPAVAVRGPVEGAVEPARRSARSRLPAVCGLSSSAHSAGVRVSATSAENSIDDRDGERELLVELRR